MTTKSSHFEWSLKGGATVVYRFNNKHLMTCPNGTGNVSRGGALEMWKVEIQ